MESSPSLPPFPPYVPALAQTLLTLTSCFSHLHPVLTLNSFGLNPFLGGKTLEVRKIGKGCPAENEILKNEKKGVSVRTHLRVVAIFDDVVVVHLQVAALVQVVPPLVERLGQHHGQQAQRQHRAHQLPASCPHPHVHHGQRAGSVSLGACRGRCTLLLDSLLNTLGCWYQPLVARTDR